MARELELFLTRLEQTTGVAPRRSGDGWQAHCPAHDDQRSSLSITSGTAGRVLVYCHAGCTPQAICRALELDLSALMPENDAAERELVRYVAARRAELHRVPTNVPQRVLRTQYPVLRLLNRLAINACPTTLRPLILRPRFLRGRKRCVLSPVDAAPSTPHGNIMINLANASDSCSAGTRPTARRFDRWPASRVAGSSARCERRDPSTRCRTFCPFPSRVARQELPATGVVLCDHYRRLQPPRPSPGAQGRATQANPPMFGRACTSSKARRRPTRAGGSASCVQRPAAARPPLI
jgi:hypothetical protein